MTAFPSSARHDEGRLWAIALGLSLFSFWGIFVVAATIRPERPANTLTRDPQSPPSTIGVIKIAPTQQIPATTRPRSLPLTTRRPFGRAEDRSATAKPTNPAFQGERNSVADSPSTPVAGAPPLPSQTGSPQKTQELDLTNQRFQPSPASPQNSPPSPPSAAAPPLSETRTIDRPVIQKPETTPPKKLRLPSQDDLLAPSDSPAEQRKTNIVGSISRGNQSALDVEDTPLGRYHAAVSRAVESEWQQKIRLHGDLIVSGFLTARFTIGTDGKVRTVSFENEIEGGQVQKGFTLDSIREAAIPPMPPALRKAHAQQPLELVFRFFF